VDEVFDLDEADLGCDIAGADLDEFAAESDVAGLTDFADVGVRRVVGFGHLGRCGEPDQVRVDGFEAVALGGGGVVDALVGALAVVVEPEPVEELLEMIEVEGGSFVGESLFEGAVEPF
jgi:hypothetical protein